MDEKMAKVMDMLSQMYFMVQENRRAKTGGFLSVYSDEDLVAMAEELTDAFREVIQGTASED